MLQYIWKEKHGKTYIFLQVIVSILNSLFPIIYIILPGLIINELTNEKRVNLLITYLLILGLSPLINHIKDITIRIYVSSIRMKLIRTFNVNFQNHVADMDYETFEKPDIRIRKQRVSINAPAPLYMTDRLLPLFGAAVNIIATFSIIVTLNPAMILLVFVVMFVNSVITKRINNESFKIKKEISIYDNAYYTHFFELTDSASAKEIRLYKLKSFFITLFSSYGTEIDRLALKEEKYKSYMQTFHIVTNLSQQVILYAYLIYQVLVKNLAIGSMTIYLSSIEQFTRSLNNIFNKYLDIVKYSLDVNEYMDFMNIPSIQRESGDKKPTFDHASIIEFRNVSFQYPGSSNYALRNLNLKIYGDKKLCIVGANGSGKTTFIKLLTRLYSPTEGEILLNDININEYDMEEYQALFAPVFQDYNIYNLTLASNIALSNEYDAKKIEDVGTSSDIDYAQTVCGTAGRCCGRF